MKIAGPCSRAPNPPRTDLGSIAREVRASLVRMSYRAKAPHLASSLSCVDILVAAYWSVLNVDSKNPHDPDRDRLIFSKGHASSALYAVLARRGFFPMNQLEHYAAEGGRLAEQPIPFAVPGVELATGSLGHGLSVGVGMALASRIQHRTYRTLVIMSDGECNEGSVWEAAMFAPAQQLDRLAVIIDFNRWQATGRSEQVMALQPLADKFKTFGWHSLFVDGHNFDDLIDSMKKVPHGSGKPLAIVAHTIKGRGVSFMEGDNNWHYRIPSRDELAASLRELAPA